MRWLCRYLFSRESWDEWYRRVEREAPRSTDQHPYGEFLANHPGVWFLLHFCSFSVIAETGADGLEPAAVNWFWAPFLAFLTTVQDCTYPQSRFGLWVRKHPHVAYWVAWAVGALLVPYLIWDDLKFFDKKFAHPLRDGIGKMLGLGGQTGFLIALCAIIGIVVLICEIRHRRQGRR